MELLRDCLYLLLLLALSALRPVFSGDGPTVVNLTGSVDGSVLLKCSVSHLQKITILYFQKRNATTGADIFVNGFHHLRPMEGSILPQYRNRTSVDTRDFSMMLWNLRVSDEGHYICAIMINNDMEIQTYFSLTVTAAFSVPNVTVERHTVHPDGEESWLLRCWSSGGYPPDNLNWTVWEEEPSNLQMEGDSETSAEEPSGVWTISATATFNCRQPANITCSVRDAESPPHTICKGKDSLYPFEYTVIIAVVVLAVFILFVIVIIKVRQRQPQQEGEELRTVQAEPSNHSPLLDQAG